MNKKFLYLILCLLIITAGGCKTSKSMSGNQLDSSPEGKFQYAMQKGNLDIAEKIWIDNQMIFINDQDTMAELGEATTGFINNLKPLMTNSTADISAVVWPAPQGQWPAIKAKMDKAGSYIRMFETNSVLADLGKTPLELVNLQKVYELKAEAIRKDAGNHFQAYTVFTAPDFFKSYAMKLDEKEFLEKQSAFLNKKISESTGNGIPHMIKTYGEYLPAETRKAMEKQYFRNVLRRYSGNKAPSLRAVIKAVQEVKKHGLPITEIPDTKIAFVRVTSKSMLKEHGIEFGLGFDVDLPIKTEQSKAKGMFSSATAKDADIVILINETVSKLDRRANAEKKYKSKFITGYRESYNPDFDKARMILEQLRIKRDELNLKVEQNARFGLMGLAVIAAMSGEIDSVESQYQSAVTNATNTPHMVEKPVFQKYDYRVLRVDDRKIASVQYFIIDRRAKTYFEDTFDVVQQQTFKVAYGVQDEDPEASQILAKYKSDSDVRNWEKQSVEVRLSDLLGHYVNQQGKDNKYRDVAEIQKKIMNNRNKALAEFYSAQYGADMGNDPRFDSVVQIFNPNGSSGSGFFVTDDIVITNHHVIDGSDYAEMKLHNKMETFGKVIAIDPFRDLALVKVSVRGKPVRFYEGNTIPVGVTLDAIGHPHGYKFTITRGIFSAFRKMPSHHVNSLGKKIRYIQTDAAVNPGNSGGPLFYKDRIVGVNSWKNAQEATSNLCFAVHYAEVIDFLKQYNIKYRM